MKDYMKTHERLSECFSNFKERRKNMEEKSKIFFDITKYKKMN
jgi:hypothetical protein